MKRAGMALAGLSWWCMALGAAGARAADSAPGGSSAELVPLMDMDSLADAFHIQAPMSFLEVEMGNVPRPRRLAHPIRFRLPATEALLAAARTRNYVEFPAIRQQVERNALTSSCTLLFVKAGAQPVNGAFEFDVEMASWRIFEREPATLTHNDDRPRKACSSFTATDRLGRIRLGCEITNCELTIAEFRKLFGQGGAELFELSGAEPAPAAKVAGEPTSYEAAPNEVSRPARGPAVAAPSAGPSAPSAAQAASSPPAAPGAAAATASPPAKAPATPVITSGGATVLERGD